MSNFVLDLCELLNVPSSNMQEVLMQLAFCIENNRQLDSDSWPVEIQEITVTDEDVCEIRAKLKTFIMSKPDDHLLATAIWAFGKGVLVEDKHFLCEILKANLEGDSSVLYQAMCALNNIGEKLFNNGRSSMLDVEENRAAAKEYLAEK